MRFNKVFFIVLAALSAFACAPEPKPSTPLETLKSYTQAIKRKDTTAMKLLLSDASLKMAEQEARAQNETVDDVVKNEKLFTESQNRLEYRNEKSEGDHATIEVKDSYNSWNTVAFVLEQGVWKIDKQEMANKMLEEMEEKNKQLDDMKNKELDDIINQGRIP
jgi:hypothetical protein